MRKSKQCVLFNLIVVILITVMTLSTVMVIAMGIVFTPDFCDIIEENAIYFSVDKALIYAIVKAESNFRADAVSPRGALGLMQLMPETARWMFDQLGYVHNGNIDFCKFIIRPEINVLLATGYLRYLIDKFGDVDLAIIAYNAGEGRLSKWLDEGVNLKSDIPYRETKDYLNRVKLYKLAYNIKL